MKILCPCCAGVVDVTWRSGRLCFLSLVSFAGWLGVVLAQVRIVVGHP